jgi:hypothetical protein
MPHSPISRQTQPLPHGTGRKMAWNRTWKTSGRQLSEQVVVSVAVDIEARHGPGFWCREKLGKW